MRIKTIISLTITVLILTMLVGCNLKNLRSSMNDTKEAVDNEKTQIYIGLGTNGLTEWMDFEAKKFEEEYKDVSFEDGKVGVQVYYNFNNNYQNYDTFPLQYSKYPEKLFITERIPYRKIKEFAIEITDICTEPLNINNVTKKVEGTDTSTIASTMTKSFNDYYGYEGRYYALPCEEVRGGLVYDVDLFNEYALYFAKESSDIKYEYTCYNVYTEEEGTYYFVDSYADREWTSDDLETGPDGEYGTYDDGLPRTYEEFFALCDYMYKEFNITPICWAGKVQSYFSAILENLAADYHKEEFRLISTFNGETTVACFDQDGKLMFNEDGSVKTERITINEHNGYRLTDQIGFYYGLKFLQTILDSDYYDYSQCFGGTIDHLTTQRTYLQSKTSAVNKPIAMLCEGSWWLGEASGKFASMAETYGEEWSKENRNFGYIPTPKVSLDELGQQSYSMILDMNMFITDACPEKLIPLYKLFIKHIYRRDGLIDFLRITGIMRPFDLELTEDEYNSLIGFGKANYNMHKASNPLFMVSYNKIFNSNESIFNSSQGLHTKCQLGGTPSMIMNPKLKDKLDYKTYFEQIHAYWDQESWDMLVKNYYSD